MKALIRLLGKKTIRRGLDHFPPPPAGPAPPPFLGGALGGRAGQLAAYQGWVFAAVNVIARRVAGIPLRLYGQALQSQGEEIGSHPLLSLLARPNTILSGRALRHTLVSHLELTGMAFVLVAENALGLPAELWPLSPADLVEIKTGPDTGQPISGFVFSGPGGKRITYRPEHILYLRHPSPDSLIYGASPIKAMAHAFDIDLAVRIYQRNFFANSARPEMVLSTDQRLTEQEARRILTGWRQKHQGLAHVFEPTILDGGLKMQPVSFSAKDFEFMSLASWTQDNILAAYGVPAGKLGLVKDVNRANALGIDITFNTECIKPRLDLIEDALNSFLLPRYGQGLVLRHDNPVPSDRAQTHKEAMQQLDRGVITINEMRAGLGKSPVPWGDAPLSMQRTQDEPSPQAQSKALSGQVLEQAGELAREHYPRLAARFHGWSRAKVEAELAKRPELLAGLVPAKADQYESKYFNKYFGEALAKGLEIQAALSGLSKEDGHATRA